MRQSPYNSLATQPRKSFSERTGVVSPFCTLVTDGRTALLESPYPPELRCQPDALCIIVDRGRMQCLPEFLTPIPRTRSIFFGKSLETFIVDLREGLDPIAVFVIVSTPSLAPESSLVKPGARLCLRLLTNNISSTLFAHGDNSWPVQAPGIGLHRLRHRSLRARDAPENSA